MQMQQGISFLFLWGIKKNKMPVVSDMSSQDLAVGELISSPNNIAFPLTFSVVRARSHRRKEGKLGFSEQLGQVLGHPCDPAERK